MSLRQRFERALAELAKTEEYPLARPPEPRPDAYAYVVPDLPEGENLADWTSARTAIGCPCKDAAFDANGSAVRVFRVGGAGTHFACFDVRTGKAVRPEWTQRAAGLTAFVLGRGMLVAAFPDATVRVFGDNGAERARLQLRGNANVTALALDAPRGRLAIGRERGEVAVYTLGGA